MVTRLEKDTTYEAIVLRDLEAFCKKKGIPCNIKQRTVLGHKFIVKNKRAYTLEGKDILKEYHKYTRETVRKENRTGEYGTKHYF